MQEFLSIERSKPTKRAPSERKGDFGEIYTPLSFSAASEQASRCAQCGNPFCHHACPLHNFIPFWLKRAANNDLSGAWEILAQTNPFPEITGRVCPQERLCEGACTLGTSFGAVNIGALEVVVSENALEAGLNPLAPFKFESSDTKNSKKVAIIGSGPAGLSAATFLLRGGVKPVVFEAAPRAGGLLAYGIPGFKVQKKVVERRVKMLEDAGCEFRLGQKIDEAEFAKISGSFDAVILATGAREPRGSGLSKEDAKGVYSALDFLTAAQASLYHESENAPDLRGKKVVVVGGGDTAMDCLRVALRLGAREAVCAYRRAQSDMGGSRKEYINAAEEGAEFRFNLAPTAIVTNEAGAVVALEVAKTIIKDGRVELLKGTESQIQADVIIFALGFGVKKEGFFSANGIEFSRTVSVSEEFRTSKAGIYACGDCASGSALVVTAAASGKGAALSVLRDLGL